jgi:hypothetical protein
MIIFVRVLLIFLIVNFYSCKSQRNVLDKGIFTVNQLFDNRFQYASMILDVRGELIDDYHGKMLCGENEEHCFLIYPPEAVPNQEFKTVKDSLYQKFVDLDIPMDRESRKRDEGKIFATLRGRFETYTLTKNWKPIVIRNAKPGDITYCRFVLKRVLALDIRTIK